MFVVLLYVMMSPTLSAPVPEHQCTTLNNGQVRCDLPSSIIPEMSDPTCHIDWNIDNTPVVKYENGKLEYKYPVITATMESVTVDGCNGSLVCDFSCPKTDVTKSLLFSCQNDAHRSTSKGSSGASIYTPHYMLLIAGITTIILLTV